MLKRVGLTKFPEIRRERDSNTINSLMLMVKRNGGTQFFLPQVPMMEAKH